MNNWREEIISKEYVTFEILYDSFPYWLDEGEVGGYLDTKTPERYKKILFDFVDNLYTIYGNSVAFVFSSTHDNPTQSPRYMPEMEYQSKRIAWWLVRSCDKYAEAIYQYQKMLDDSKLDKTTLTSTSKSSSSELPLNSQDYDNPTATSSGSTSTETRLPIDNYLQIKNMIEDIKSKWLYEFEQKFVYNVTNQNLV